MNITDKDFEERGYQKGARPAFEPLGVLYIYYKRFAGADNKTKYYITAKKWNLSIPGKENYNGYEYEVQLHEKDAGNVITMTFHRE